MLLQCQYEVDCLGLHLMTFKMAINSFRNALQITNTDCMIDYKMKQIITVGYFTLIIMQPKLCY